MASSVDGQPKIELVRPAASDQDPTELTSNHPTTLSADEQQAVGYPPVIGYPSGDLRCPYAHSHPAPPMPSTMPLPHQHPGVPFGEWSRLSRFSRGVHLGIAFFAIVFITVTIIIQVTLRPRMPEFLMSGFAVSNIGVSNDTVLMANWEVAVTVRNMNNHIKLLLPSVASIVYYWDDPQLSLLAMKVEAPLNLGGRKSGMIAFEATSVASNDIAAMKAVRHDLDANKKVTFCVGMEVMMKFKYSWWWKKHDTVMVYCDDFPVEFTSDGYAYNGSLPIRDKPIGCDIFTNW